MRSNEEIKAQHLANIGVRLGANSEAKILAIKTLIHGTLRMSGEFDELTTTSQKVEIIQKIFDANTAADIDPGIAAIRTRITNRDIAPLIGANGREEVVNFNMLNPADRIYLLAESMRDLLTHNEDGSLVNPTEIDAVNTAIDVAIATIPHITESMMTRLTDLFPIMDMLSIEQMEAVMAETDLEDAETERLLRELSQQHRNILSRRLERVREGPIQSSLELAAGISLISMAYRENYMADFSGAEGLFNSSLAAVANSFLAAGLIDAGTATVREVRRFTEGETDLGTRVMQLVGAGLATYLQSQQNTEAGIEGVEGASLLAGAAAFGVGATTMVRNTSYNVANRTGLIRFLSENTAALQNVVGDFMNSNFYQPANQDTQVDVEDPLIPRAVSPRSGTRLSRQEQGQEL
jgi:hypothetical protein